MATVQRNVKVVLPHGDIRRFSLPPGEGVGFLVGLLKNHVSEHEQQLCLRYVDDEGEKITLSCDEELEEAFLLCKEESKRTLKLFASKMDLLAADEMDDAGLYELADFGSEEYGDEFQDEVKTPKACSEENEGRMAPPPAENIDKSDLEPGMPPHCEENVAVKVQRSSREHDVTSTTNSNDNIVEPTSAANSLIIIDEDDAVPAADQRIFGDVLQSNNPSLASSYVSSVDLDNVDSDVNAVSDSQDAVTADSTISPRVLVNDNTFVAAVQGSIAKHSARVAQYCKSQNLGLHDTMRYWFSQVFTDAIDQMRPENTLKDSETEIKEHDSLSFSANLSLDNLHGFEASVEAVAQDVSRLQLEPSWQTVAQDLADWDAKDATPNTSLVLSDVANEMDSEANAIAAADVLDQTDIVGDQIADDTKICSPSKVHSMEDDAGEEDGEEDALSLLEIGNNHDTTVDSDTKSDAKADEVTVRPELQIPENFAYRAEVNNLVEMGFTEVDLNCLLLSRNNGNLDRVIEWLLNKPQD